MPRRALVLSSRVARPGRRASCSSACSSVSWRAGLSEGPANLPGLACFFLPSLSHSLFWSCSSLPFLSSCLSPLFLALGITSKIWCLSSLENDGQIFKASTDKLLAIITRHSTTSIRTISAMISQAGEKLWTAKMIEKGIPLRGVAGWHLSPFTYLCPYLFSSHQGHGPYGPFSEGGQEIPHLCPFPRLQLFSPTAGNIE